MIQKMRENDLSAELNFDNIPNIDQIDPAYMEMSQAFDPENKYSVPYSLGNGRYPVQYQTVRRAWCSGTDQMG